MIPSRTKTISNSSKEKENKEEEEEEDCGVCMEENEGAKMVTLPCNHTFHRRCISE